MENNEVSSASFYINLLIWFSEVSSAKNLTADLIPSSKSFI